MPRYHIYYTKYSNLARTDVPYIKIVETEDVYHEMGKLVSSSLEAIRNVRYTLPAANVQEIEALWVESGYVKLFPNLWVKSSDDFAPITRCKYCKHFKAYDPPGDDFDGICNARSCETDREEYCSYGERKDGDHT